MLSYKLTPPTCYTLIVYHRMLHITLNQHIKFSTYTTNFTIKWHTQHKIHDKIKKKRETWNGSDKTKLLDIQKQQKKIMLESGRSIENIQKSTNLNTKECNKKTSVNVKIQWQTNNRIHTYNTHTYKLKEYLTSVCGVCFTVMHHRLLRHVILFKGQNFREQYLKLWLND